eukprot:TRINITY_DN52706_c0_g1_i1.p1 TRINITY_DN52706_c0_g1~~TRINITY_DN52706_c0_g1_i1.p1  ORF type:complete len:130 (+),score=10.09 TRINITY_DN52706_c0_g1_i1:129-518(+)
MIRRPPRSTLSSSSAASDVYKRQLLRHLSLMPPSCPFLHHFQNIQIQYTPLIVITSFHVLFIFAQRVLIFWKHQANKKEGQVGERKRVSQKVGNDAPSLFYFFHLLPSLTSTPLPSSCLLYTSPSPRDS